MERHGVAREVLRILKPRARADCCDPFVASIDAGAERCGAFLTQEGQKCADVARNSQPAAQRLDERTRGKDDVTLKPLRQASATGARGGWHWRSPKAYAGLDRGTFALPPALPSVQVTVAFPVFEHGPMLSEARRCGALANYN